MLMAFYSKYKPIIVTSVLLSLVIIILLVCRRGTGQQGPVVQETQYVVHYHKQDMEDLKTKTSALQGCNSKLMEVQLELSYNVKRVKELQQELREALTRRPKYLSGLPLIFAVTPTYKRWTQKADLTQLCQTLSHIPSLRWIVIEDSTQKTQLVTNLLARCPVNSTHLNFKTSPSLLDNPPSKNSSEAKKPHVKKPRGIEQRNVALKWIRRHYRLGKVNGVVYFADDDNTYDLRVFDEMRSTKMVSVWPVGLAGGLKFEGPICSGDTVKHWYAYWARDRKFQIDFAGFAVNIDIILNTKALILTTSKPGYVENDFLEQLIEFYDLEAKADSCQTVLVWHTRTEKPPMFYEDQLAKMGHPSNPRIEV